MAIFSGLIRSHYLALDTNLSVVLPHDREEVRQAPKVLFLLHGLGENDKAWLRYTGIERYVRERNYVLILPDANTSFYSDMACGNNYYSYIASELPQLCRKLFGLKIEKHNTFIAGLSMGGYGALKTAMRNPGKFAACAGFSSCTDITSLEGFIGYGNELRLEEQLVGVFGENGVNSEELNLFKIAENFARLPEEERPGMYISCGLDDFLLPMNKEFACRLKALGIKFTCENWHGGHDWNFWDASIKKALYFFDSF